jgi:hypothetical protein
MIGLDDQALCRIFIGATAVPHAEHGRWLREIAGRMEAAAAAETADLARTRQRELSPVRRSQSSSAMSGRASALLSPATVGFRDEAAQRHVPCRLTAFACCGRVAEHTPRTRARFSGMNAMDARSRDLTSPVIAFTPVVGPTRTLDLKSNIQVRPRQPGGGKKNQHKGNNHHPLAGIAPVRPILLGTASPHNAALFSDRLVERRHPAS